MYTVIRKIKVFFSFNRIRCTILLSGRCLRHVLSPCLVVIWWKRGDTYKAKRMIYTPIIRYKYFMSTHYTQKLELIYFRSR